LYEKRKWILFNSLLNKIKGGVMGEPLEAVSYSTYVGGYIACSRAHLDRVYVIPEALYQIHWEHWMKQIPAHFFSALDQRKLAHTYVMQNWHTGMRGIVEVPVEEFVLE
jgi:hypothetical protein